MRGVPDEDLDLGLYCKCGSQQEARGIPEHAADKMAEQFWDHPVRATVKSVKKNVNKSDIRRTNHHHERDPYQRKTG